HEPVLRAEATIISMLTISRSARPPRILCGRRERSVRRVHVEPTDGLFARAAADPRFFPLCTCLRRRPLPDVAARGQAAPCARVPRLAPDQPVAAPTGARPAAARRAS